MIVYSRFMMIPMLCVTIFVIFVVCFVFFFFMRRLTPRSTLFPYTTLFRSQRRGGRPQKRGLRCRPAPPRKTPDQGPSLRSEEHTSELQSHSDLVCRLLLEKKK